MHISVIMPALNEAEAIGDVLRAMPDRVSQVIVVDNGSTDDTAAVAQQHGATVVHEPQRGYGKACLAGIAQAMRDAPDVIVFMDADGSDDPAQLDRLLEPIARGEADMAIGSRTLGRAERGALSPTQRFGNALACTLMRWLYGARHSDLGPFRAITAAGLHRLAMDDEDFGWTIQMQIRAAVAGLAVAEVPVDYRRRQAGRSKISGTVRGVLAAGRIILRTVFNERRRSVKHRYADVPPRGRVCVMVRYPQAGRCKTRLIPALGEQGAADLHRQMAEHTFALAQTCARFQPVQIEAWYTGGDEAEMAGWLGDALRLHAQPGGDLGQRLRAALMTDPPTIFIGTDCPGVTPDHLRRALAALQTHDMVIGPATDGGYYLIGGHVPDIQIDWGTDTVRQQTLDWAAEHGLTVAMLDELADVDRPEDLHIWEQVRDKSRR